jgi:hypothetical protein
MNVLSLATALHSTSESFFMTTCEVFFLQKHSQHDGCSRSSPAIAAVCNAQVTTGRNLGLVLHRVGSWSDDTMCLSHRVCFKLSHMSRTCRSVRLCRGGLPAQLPSLPAQLFHHRDGNRKHACSVAEPGSFTICKPALLCALMCLQVGECAIASSPSNPAPKAATQVNKGLRHRPAAWMAVVLQDRHKRRLKATSDSACMGMVI